MSCCSQQASNVQRKNRWQEYVSHRSSPTGESYVWKAAKGGAVPPLWQAGGGHFHTSKIMDAVINWDFFLHGFQHVLCSGILRPLQNMVYPRDYPTSSLCQLRPGWGGELERNKTKYLENWNGLRKQQRLIPPASSSMHTSRRPFPLATGAAGCLWLSQLGSGFSQMAMHCSHKLTATKTQQPQHNTTIYLFIYFKCGVL